MSNMSTEVEPVSMQHNKTDDTADPPDHYDTQSITLHFLHFLQAASKLAAPDHRCLVDSTFDLYPSETNDGHTSGSADPAVVPSDFNSNLLVTVNPPFGDAKQPFPSTPKQPACNEELAQEISQPNGETSVPEGIKDQNAQRPPMTQLPHLSWMGDVETTAPQRSTTPSTAEEDIQTPAASEQAPSMPSIGRTKTPRKQAHPKQSVVATDPDFQGLIFSMESQLDYSRGQCRLLVNYKYSVTALYTPQDSCIAQKKTQAEETGVPELQLRRGPDPNDVNHRYQYKRHKIRCTNCWHIPVKVTKLGTSCLKCGNGMAL
ncbi:hypothetical protein NHX12_018848 [Muraenolepis orangiensis]|uniref:Uncharacterized protein n=1 Tax=Muraenolepis orangiensis TaxID=630683 RepID=A0A9Q0IYA2_9TELE|nr:hypothetical protein NHX12_018848 [Muraenolepis orangiensis]